MPSNRYSSFRAIAWGALAALLISAMGWALNANGRIAAVEIQAQTRERVEIEIRKEQGEIRKELVENSRSLARIEGKLDAVLEKHANGH